MHWSAELAGRCRPSPADSEAPASLWWAAEWGSYAVGRRHPSGEASSVAIAASSGDTVSLQLERRGRLEGTVRKGPTCVLQAVLPTSTRGPDGHGPVRVVVCSLNGAADQTTQRRGTVYPSESWVWPRHEGVTVTS